MPPPDDTQDLSALKNISVSDCQSGNLLVTNRNIEKRILDDDTENQKLPVESFKQSELQEHQFDHESIKCSKEIKEDGEAQKTFHQSKQVEIPKEVHIEEKIMRVLDQESSL